MAIRCPRPPMEGETREEFVQAMTQQLARSVRTREAHRIAFEAWDEHERDMAEHRLRIALEVEDAERGA